MKSRISKRHGHTVLILASLAAFAQAEMSTYPWAQYLSDMMNNIESKLPVGYALPPNFKTDIFNQIPNDTFIMDTDRPFCKTRSAAKYTPDTEEIGRESEFHLYLYQLMTKRYGIPKNIALRLLAKKLSPFCKVKTTDCDLNTPYRTIDGSCNNFKNVYWGAAFRPFERVLPAAYEDDLMEPRGGLKHSHLPNPRKITTTIHYDIINPDPTITNMVPQMGLMVNHDMSLTPEGDRLCCTSDKEAIDCWPIQIPKDDSFYSNLSQPQTCMDFTRSTPFCFPGRSEIREQFNMISAYLDASIVYGSDAEKADQLRSYVGGKLAVHSNNGNMLPTVAEIEEARNIEIPFTGKYLAGDERVNEMPALITMHTLLHREHNRIADKISKIRPEWTDEKLFQEARRIFIAEWQNIIYSEYLPVILGQDTMVKYSLQLDDGFSTYDGNVNPTIYNAFTTAAYRFGHTLINGIIKLYKGLKKVGSYELKDNFNESDEVDRNDWDGYNLILGGLMIQNAIRFDPHVTTALTKCLLKNRTAEFGGDLMARNVQRGRDHGIPPYTEYRQFCNIRPLTTWDQKPKEILQDTWNKLQSLYKSPLEIDLFTGGLSEIPLDDAFSGATFNCLKAIQFKRLKYGDRFFFTHGNQTGSFTLEQLANLRTRTLGDIICENSDVTMTTENVLKVPSESNPQRFCNDMTRSSLDFELLLPSNF